MRNRRHLLSDHEGTREIWPAFTDVMSTMALILFVLVLLAFVRSVIRSKELDALKVQIGASERELGAVRAELATGRAALAASDLKLRDQQRVIADSDRQLEGLRAQLQSIAVLRVDVLTKLKQAIEAELGARSSGGAALVSIGDNGNVVLNESLVFESGSYAIKPDAKPLLDGLARALGNLLANDEVRENIDAVVIQGHTDERGSASYNWDLSAKRATAVLDYLFDANRTLADSYGRFFAASAFSKFRPLDLDKTDAAYQRNRRIEISVVPKDSNLRKVIDEYMKSAPPPP